MTCPRAWRRRRGLVGGPRPRLEPRECPGRVSRNPPGPRVRGGQAGPGVFPDPGRRLRRSEARDAGPRPGGLHATAAPRAAVPGACRHRSGPSARVRCGSRIADRSGPSTSPPARRPGGPARGDVACPWPSGATAGAGPRDRPARSPLAATIAPAAARPTAGRPHAAASRRLSSRPTSRGIRARFGPIPADSFPGKASVGPSGLTRRRRVRRGSSAASPPATARAIPAVAALDAHRPGLAGRHPRGEPPRGGEVPGGARGDARADGVDSRTGAADGVAPAAGATDPRTFPTPPFPGPRDTPGLWPAGGGPSRAVAVFGLRATTTFNIYVSSSFRRRYVE